MTCCKHCRRYIRKALFITHVGWIHAANGFALCDIDDPGNSEVATPDTEDEK